jgi:imidazolonepropionase-like amidohydrolase
VYPDPDAVPIDDAVVILTGGQISGVGPRAAAAVPSGATVIDVKGLVITAGFQNSHVHFTDMTRWAAAGTQPAGALTGHLREMVTKYGFTTVVDTASDLANTKAIRRRIESGEVSGPRILTAGFAIYPPDGVPYYVRDETPAEVLRLLPQPTSPAAASAIVTQQLDDGANLVKLFAGSWVERGKVLPMPADIAGAAAREAHARKLPVLAHPSNLAGLEVALGAGVDVLAHALDDTRGVTDAHYARMKSQNLAMIPTLSLFRGRWMWDILDEVRSFARQGGQILFGTDVGYLPNFDHAIEYDLMAAAGLGWREILASLTVNPAERFGDRTRRGRVATGFEADLVVLGSDPAHGVRNFSDVRYAIRAGRVIYQAP